ncbi:MAG: glycoside hydrolase family 2 protein [Halanaerobiaceae bacterium]|jgi:beta-mannosidase|nr:glycoside hydrolase family 2 protein [Halanaerobiaceae bacterium]
MQRIALNGEWTLNRTGKNDNFTASVPGCVHLDLLAEGFIDDPFFRDNEKELMWIGETDWDYSREFIIEKEILDHDKILLKCHGLDTLAVITVNEREIGRTDNMYRSLEFDLKPVLVEGKNYIKVHFDAVMPYLREKEKERYLPAWSVGDHRLNSGSWIRKQPSNFGWDWGPMMVTCGIWRDIEIIAFNKGRITDINILQDHSKKETVMLDIRTEVELTVDDNLEIKVQIEYEGNTVAESAGKVIDGRFDVNLEIRNPELWWPNGMGEQPLYTVNVFLYDETGSLLSKESKRIGLRNLELVLEDDQWGQSFKFAVNGIPFFAKGANWIPADTFVARLDYQDYYSLLEDAAAVNMNMIRVWGGGIYEDDDFYDICDELGLCVWQDFMFACSTYPSFDEEYMENVRIEAEENVKRIRHHACLALWCGNNELEQGIAADEWDIERVKMSWDDYSKLFDELLPGLVKKYSPQVPYWPSSPHSPVGDREDFYNPRCGDAHIWDIWHGKKPFEWYRNCEHRFNSEFGFQSFPEPKTVFSFTIPEDRNITSYVMEHHQRSGIGNTTIIQYMLDWFRLPHGFENLLWTSQILQGLGIKYAVEHWRRGMPRGMGTLYWQLNDCWPVSSWSSIDYYGRWKALHYMARRFYAPLLVSAVEDNERWAVEIHVTSDKLEKVDGEFFWLLTDVKGNMISSGEKPAEIPAQTSSHIMTLELAEEVEKTGPRNLMLWLEFRVDDKVVSDNFVSFSKPKHMELMDPGIKYLIEELGDNVFKIALSVERPALWTWLELKNIDAIYSDNFFHLYPGKEHTLIIVPEEELSEKELEEMLIVRSLIDTYN